MCLLFSDVAEEKPDGERKGESGIRLSPFGLAAYKMQNDVWLNIHTLKDYEKLCDLQNAADSWLKQLSYSHYDFNYFTAHSNMDHGGYSLWNHSQPPPSFLLCFLDGFLQETETDVPSFNSFDGGKLLDCLRYIFLCDLGGFWFCTKTVVELCKHLMQLYISTSTKILGLGFRHCLTYCTVAISAISCHRFHHVDVRKTTKLSPSCIGFNLLLFYNLETLECQGSKLRRIMSSYL